MKILLLTFRDFALPKNSPIKLKRFLGYGEFCDDNADMIVYDTAMDCANMNTGLKMQLGAVYAKCRENLVPFCEISSDAAKPADMFHIPIPDRGGKNEIIQRILAIGRGFAAVKKYTHRRKTKCPGYSETITGVLGEKAKQFEIYPYVSNFDKLFDLPHMLYMLEQNSKLGRKRRMKFKQRFVAYLSGHLILNSILEYPGPVLHQRALCALCAVHPSEYARIAKFFKSVVYKGAFNKTGNYFWRDAAKDKLWDCVEKTIGDEEEYGSYGEMFRVALERKYKMKFKRPTGCECDGQHGGYWCPFSGQAVCERENCGIPNSVYLPSGASECRIARKYWDRWKPLLGT